MFRNKLLTCIWILLLIVAGAGCRKDDQSATPTPTAVPPTRTIPAATATPASLGLIPTGFDAAPSPQLVGQNPPTEGELTPDGVLELYFDQPMDRDATAAALEVVDADGRSLPGEISWPQPRILRFKPDKSLPPNR
ncbi:MAG: hypothetical protein ACE5EY_09040 [Anaerolineae bacterium]